MPFADKDVMTGGFRKQKLFSLRRKIVLLLSLMLMTTLFSYVYIVIRQYRADKKRYVQDLNHQYVVTLGEKIKIEMNYLESTLKDVEEMGFDSKNYKSVMMLKKAMFRTEHLLAIAIVDEQKQNLAYLSHSGRIRTSLLKEKTIKDVIRSDQFHRADQFLEAQKTAKGYLFLSTKKLADGKKAIFVSSSKVFQVMNEDVKGKELLVLDSEGRPIIMFPNSDKTEDMLHPIKRFASKIPLVSAGKIFGYKRYGAKHMTWFFGDFFKLPHSMMIVSQVEMRAALADAKKIMIIAILMALIMLGVCIIVGIRFASTITKPLNKLMTLTEDIAVGKYLVDISEINSRDEIHELAQHFKQLGIRLHEREIALEEQTELANKDGLTKLFNHRYFKNTLNREIKLAQRHGGPLSLIMLDVDHFKKFNDTYGHQQGDEVLRHLSVLLMQCARDTDVVARYGGEEFSLVLPQTDNEGATILAQRICDAFAAHDVPNLEGGDPIRCSCSLGVATLVDSNFRDDEELIQAADEYLYMAKEAGRNQVSNGTKTQKNKKAA